MKMNNITKKFLNRSLIVLSLIFIGACGNPKIVPSIDQSPASVVELTITSDKSRMPGIAYLAAGSGPHPTVLLLHGYPGNEKNLDVAQELRRQGWNVVFFHYRGAWGAEGEFSFRGAERDVQVVLGYMSDQANAQRLRIDPKRISLVGHSMGGHMAIAGIYDNPQVNCAVAYDPVNLGAKGSGIFSDPATAKMWRDYSDTLFMLQGWSGDKAEREIIQHGADLDLVKRANKLNNRPLMIIPADTQVVPMALHIDPLIAVHQAIEGNQFAYRLIDDDHSFSATRLELIDTTAKFLNSSCK